MKTLNPGRQDAHKIHEALKILGEDLSPELNARAEAVLERVYARDNLDPTTIVAAFVGATGSGKSSLFNALVGSEVARVDVVRPTTRMALAVLPRQSESVGEGPSSEGEVGRLLDWLGVQQRVAMPATSVLGDSLVLLDVPDIDSVDRANGELAARLAQRVDLLVWVVDPQKYADHVIHSQWIRPMASRAQATLVVLNQVDRLNEGERASVLTSLHRLLIDDGIESPTILLVSARSGEGVAELAVQMNERSAFLRRVAVAREAQIRDLAAEIAAAIELDEWAPKVGVAEACDGIARTMAESDSMLSVSVAVKKAYVHRRARSAGWLPVRLLRQFRSDPLNRLHLSGGGSDSLSDVDLSALMGRSGVCVAVNRSVESLCAGRPDQWAYRLREVAASQESTLTLAIQRGLARTDVGMGASPRWWRASNTLQWLMWLVFVVGAIWLAGVHVLRSYVLLPIDVPVYGTVPVPTLLLLGGIAASLVVAGVSAAIGAVGARRRGAFARRAVRLTVEAVVNEHIRLPLEAEDQRQRQIVSLLSS